MSTLIASRYPVGIGGVFFPPALQHLHQLHHSRLGGGASTAATASEIQDANNAAAAAAAWPFAWNRAHGLQGLDQHSGSAEAAHEAFRRISPANSYKRGELENLFFYRLKFYCDNK